jgi:hypothetical protein
MFARFRQVFSAVPIWISLVFFTKEKIYCTVQNIFDYEKVNNYLRLGFIRSGGNLNKHLVQNLPAANY